MKRRAEKSKNARREKRGKGKSMFRQKERTKL